MTGVEKVFIASLHFYYMPLSSKKIVGSWATYGNLFKYQNHHQPWNDSDVGDFLYALPLDFIPKIRALGDGTAVWLVIFLASFFGTIQLGELFYAMEMNLGV